MLHDALFYGAVLPVITHQLGCKYRGQLSTVRHHKIIQPVTDADALHILMCPDIQVIMVFKGTLEITWNLLGEEVIIIAPERSVVSVPANSWRRYRAVGDDVEFILNAEGDQRKRVYWDEAILREAKTHNRGLDPDGYVSKVDVMPVTARRAGARIESLPQA